MESLRTRRKAKSKPNLSAISPVHEAFVYKWTNQENGMYYIGYHKGAEDDGYISSGKHFLTAYYTNPIIFRREILFRGTKMMALRVESEKIHHAIKTDGYEKIYNLTTWGKLQEWKRTCLVCGAVCCPENRQWAEAFEEAHFEKCSGKKLSSYSSNNYRRAIDSIDHESCPVIDIEKDDDYGIIYWRWVPEGRPIVTIIRPSGSVVVHETPAGMNAREYFDLCRIQLFRY